MSESMIKTLNAQQQEKLDLYAKLLQEENQRINITRITETEQIRLRHFEDSLVVLPILRKFEQESDRLCSLIDIGSGGGFPGLVLAIALPDWRVVSVESTGKKADFQQKIVDELELSNVEVYHERAEELAREQDFRERFDVATARALGQLSIIAELAMPFVRKGGRFMSWKGPKLAEEMQAGESAVRKLGGTSLREMPYHLPGEEDAVTGYRIFEAIKGGKTPGKYPRQYKDIKASPLGI